PLTRAVIGMARNTAGDGRTECFGDAKSELQLFLRGPQTIAEHLRARTNAQHPDLNFDPLVSRAGLQLPEVRFALTLIYVEIGKKNGIDVQRRGVVQQPGRLPTQRANRVVIEAEFKFRSLLNAGYSRETVRACQGSFAGLHEVGWAAAS